ncbi:MAG: glutathione S-transferase family protein [Geminicoccaceae bacterium]
MKLFYFETANPRKPCAVAKYLGSPVEYVWVDLANGGQKSPELLAVNPNGKVPALQDGDTKLWESHAIMAYLAVKAGSDLWPADDAKRIDIMRWLNWDTAHFSRHAGRLIFENFIKPNLLNAETNTEEVEDAAGFFKRFAAVLDDHLKDHAYLVGDALTIADFGVASFLPSADQAKLPLDGCNAIARWHDRLNELEAWREPFPSRDPDRKTA